MGYQSFKELRVWQEAKDLAIKIYEVSATGNLTKDFGLKEQMRKASVSVASNISEGYERNSNKDFIRFLFIAKGSISELRTQLEIAKGVYYIDHALFESLDNQCIKVGSMLTKLIRSRSTD